MKELDLVFQSIDSSSINPLVAMLWALAQISLIAMIATIFPFHKLRNQNKAPVRGADQDEKLPGEQKKVAAFFLKFTSICFKLFNTLLGLSTAFLGLMSIIASVSILNSDFPWKETSVTLLYTFILGGTSATVLGYGLLRHSLVAWKAYRAALVAGIFSMIFWWPDILINHGLTAVLASLVFVAGEILLVGLATTTLVIGHPKYKSLFVQ